MSPGPMSLSERATAVSLVAKHDLVQRARGEQVTQRTLAGLSGIIKKSTGELPITINFMGLCKAGKSQLQSAMLGCDLLPSESTPCTSIPTIYRHSFDRNKCRIFHAHCDENMQPQLSETPDFEGNASECRTHLNTLNARARTLAARLEQELNSNDKSQDDFILSAMRQQNVPLYTVVEVYILGLVEAGVPGEVLKKCQFVDSPGRGEAFNPVVDMTIKDITALSDLIVTVMDYKAMGTADEAQLWQSLQEQRPDLLRELGSRGLYFLSFADAAGAGAMTVDEACEHARQKVAECIKATPGEEQFTGGSGLGSAVARHMLLYYREAIMPTDSIMEVIARMVDADCPEDVTFSDAADLGEQEWMERLEEGGLPSLERKLATQLRDVDNLRESICNTDLSRIATELCSDLTATVESLEKSSEDLQKQQVALSAALAGAQKFSEEDVKPLIVERKEEALRIITRTIMDIETALKATVNDLMRVGERGQTQTFQNEAAAQAHVTKLAGEISGTLRETFGARADSLRDLVNDETGSVVSVFQNRILTSFKSHMEAAFESLDVATPQVGDVNIQEIEQEKENIRRVVAALGTVNDDEIRRGIKGFVKANNYTEKSTVVKTKRVRVGSTGFWFWKRDVYANQTYSEEVTVKRTNYPVRPSVVSNYVHQLYLNNLKNVKESFTGASEAALNHIESVLVAAINSPVSAAKARVDLALITKAADQDVQDGLIASLREQAELLSDYTN